PQQMLDASGDVFFFLEDTQHGMYVHTETLQLLAQDRFEQGAGSVAIDGITVQHGNVAATNRTGLHDRATLAQRVDEAIEIGLGYCERSALYRSDSQSRHGQTEIEYGRDHEAGRAVHLAKEVLVNENTAAFSGDEVGAAAWCNLNFVAAAGHFSGDCA